MTVTKVPKTWTDANGRKRRFVSQFNDGGSTLITSKLWARGSWEYKTEYIDTVMFTINLPKLRSYEVESNL